MQEAFLYEALRTPIGTGGREGALYEVKPVDLLATLLGALAKKNNLLASAIEDVVIGCVTPIDDQGFNLAKAALLRASWPAEVSGMTLQRFSCSGLEAVNLAALKVAAGSAGLVLAGGAESESRVPWGSDGGALIHDPSLVNSSSYLPEGVAADLLATLEGYSREDLDDFSLRSFQRGAARKNNDKAGISLVAIRDRNGLPLLERDEALGSLPDEEQLQDLAPYFAEIGGEGFDAMAMRKYPHLNGIQHVHTRGNFAARSDGAALILVGSKAAGDRLGLSPRARVISTGNACVEPTLMLTGAVPAAKKALAHIGLEPTNVDLWNCHESFSAVGLHFQRAFGLDPGQLNLYGGALAEGQVLGASGAILLGSLLDQLEQKDAETGLAAIGGGGGMGVATIIQRM